MIAAPGSSGSSSTVVTGLSESFFASTAWPTAANEAEVDPASCFNFFAGPAVFLSLEDDSNLRFILHGMNRRIRHQHQMLYSNVSCLLWLLLSSGSLSGIEP